MIRALLLAAARAHAPGQTDALVLSVGSSLSARALARRALASSSSSTSSSSGPQHQHPHSTRARPSPAAADPATLLPSRRTLLRKLAAFQRAMEATRGGSGQPGASTAPPAAAAASAAGEASASNNATNSANTAGDARRAQAAAERAERLARRGAMRSAAEAYVSRAAAAARDVDVDALFALLRAPPPPLPPPQHQQQQEQHQPHPHHRPRPLAQRNAGRGIVAAAAARAAAEMAAAPGGSPRHAAAFLELALERGAVLPAQAGLAAVYVLRSLRDAGDPRGVLTVGSRLFGVGGGAGGVASTADTRGGGGGGAAGSPQPPATPRRAYAPVTAHAASVALMIEAAGAVRDADLALGLWRVLGSGPEEEEGGPSQQQQQQQRERGAATVVAATAAAPAAPSFFRRPPAYAPSVLYALVGACVDCDLASSSPPLGQPPGGAQAEGGPGSLARALFSGGSALVSAARELRERWQGRRGAALAEAAAASSDDWPYDHDGGVDGEWGSPPAAPAAALAGAGPGWAAAALPLGGGGGGGLAAAAAAAARLSSSSSLVSTQSARAYSQQQHQQQQQQQRRYDQPQSLFRRGGGGGAAATAPASPSSSPLLPCDRAAALLSRAGSVHDLDALLRSELVAPGGVPVTAMAGVLWPEAGGGGEEEQEQEEQEQERRQRPAPGDSSSSKPATLGQMYAAISRSGRAAYPPSAGWPPSPAAPARSSRGGGGFADERRPSPCGEASASAAFPPALPAPLAAAAVKAYLRLGAVERASAVAHASASSAPVLGALARQHHHQQQQGAAPASSGGSGGGRPFPGGGGAMAVADVLPLQALASGCVRLGPEHATRAAATLLELRRRHGGSPSAAALAATLRAMAAAGATPAALDALWRATAGPSPGTAAWSGYLPALWRAGDRGALAWPALLEAMRQPSPFPAVAGGGGGGGERPGQHQSGEARADAARSKILRSLLWAVLAQPPAGGGGGSLPSGSSFSSSTPPPLPLPPTAAAASVALCDNAAASSALDAACALLSRLARRGVTVRDDRALAAAVRAALRLPRDAEDARASRALPRLLAAAHALGTAPGARTQRAVLEGAAALDGRRWRGGGGGGGGEEDEGGGGQEGAGAGAGADELRAWAFWRLAEGLGRQPLGEVGIVGGGA